MSIQETAIPRPFRPFDGKSAGSSDGPSRLPKHNRADPENEGYSPSFRGIEFSRKSGTTRLATKPGITLREEAIVDQDGAIKSRSWKGVTKEWRGWLRSAEETSAVFEGCNPETGEEDTVTVPLENRFMKGRQRELYAKLHDLERGVESAYGKRLNVAMLTFTASNKSGAGDWWRCPANHLDDLLASWPAVRRELHRLLKGRRWEYLRMLEPHKSGYAHVHLAVFVDGPIRPADFEPVMDAHVRHCLPASWEAHTPKGDAVAVRTGISNVAAYLSAYLMKYDEEPLEAPEHIQRFHALLWATGRRRWSVSAGAQEMMAWEPPEGESGWVWELTHIEVRSALYPLESGGDGVVMIALDDSAAGLDPPPVM